MLVQPYTFTSKNGEQEFILVGLITINGAENRIWALLAVVCRNLLVGLSLVGYLSQFIYRYLVLNRSKNVSPCKYSIIFLINLLLPLAYAVDSFICFYPSVGHEFLDDQSVADFIGLNLSDKIILAGYSNNDFNLTIGSYYIIIVCTITYAIMFTLGFLMHKYLKQLSKTTTYKDLTAKLIELNKQLSRNLFIQALMPLFVYLSILMYLMTFLFKINEWNWLQYANVISATTVLVPATINPIVSLCIISYYRSVFLTSIKKICCAARHYLMKILKC
uniref:G_PROTEIN_RECEP_F1_2 domain-containing protein n=1 Tax=Globodera pallida TaxID=36090 RepID=A0A183BZ63_GLOPA